MDQERSENLGVQTHPRCEAQGLLETAQAPRSSGWETGGVWAATRSYTATMYETTFGKCELNLPQVQVRVHVRSTQ